MVTFYFVNKNVIDTGLD